MLKKGKRSYPRISCIFQTSYKKRWKVATPGSLPCSDTRKMGSLPLSPATMRRWKPVVVVKNTQSKLRAHSNIAVWDGGILYLRLHLSEGTAGAGLILAWEMLLAPTIFSFTLDPFQPQSSTHIISKMTGELLKNYRYKKRLIVHPYTHSILREHSENSTNNCWGLTRVERIDSKLAVALSAGIPWEG